MLAQDYEEIVKHQDNELAGSDHALVLRHMSKTTATKRQIKSPNGRLPRSPKNNNNNNPPFGATRTTVSAVRSRKRSTADKQNRRKVPSVSHQSTSFAGKMVLSPNCKKHSNMSTQTPRRLRPMSPSRAARSAACAATSPLKPPKVPLLEGNETPPTVKTRQLSRRILNAEPGSLASSFAECSSASPSSVDRENNLPPSIAAETQKKDSIPLIRHFRRDNWQEEIISQSSVQSSLGRSKKRQVVNRRLSGPTTLKHGHPSIRRLSSPLSVNSTGTDSASRKTPVSKKPVNMTYGSKGQRAPSSSSKISVGPKRHSFKHANGLQSVPRSPEKSLSSKMKKGPPSTRRLSLPTSVNSADMYDESSIAPRTPNIPGPSSRRLSLPGSCSSFVTDVESNTRKTSQRLTLPESFSSAATESESVNSKTSVLERHPSSLHLSRLDSISQLDSPKTPEKIPRRMSLQDALNLAAESAFRKSPGVSAKAHTMGRRMSLPQSFTTTADSVSAESSSKMPKQQSSKLRSVANESSTSRTALESWPSIGSREGPLQTRRQKVPLSPAKPVRPRLLKRSESYVSKVSMTKRINPAAA
eukprot:scaffold4876_cov177-Amphora_coffeaeformis.AAC.6